MLSFVQPLTADARVSHVLDHVYLLTGSKPKKVFMASVHSVKFREVLLPFSLFSVFLYLSSHSACISVRAESVRIPNGMKKGAWASMVICQFSFVNSAVQAASRASAEMPSRWNRRLLVWFSSRVAAPPGRSPPTSIARIAIAEWARFLRILFSEILAQRVEYAQEVAGAAVCLVKQRPVEPDRDAREAFTVATVR